MKLFTPSEVAKQLRISRRTIYRLIEKKQLKAIKVSFDIYRIAEKDLKEFLKKRKTK
ncbi:helix-turn-helix domain-containing protein [Patescibacteria group bacterium]